MPEQKNNSTAWDVAKNEDILVLDENGQLKVLNLADNSLTDFNKIPPVNKAIEPDDNLPIATGVGRPMLSPLLPVTKKGTAAFYFHVADEEEVAQNFKTFETVPQNFKKYSLNKIWFKIKENYPLTLDEETIKKLKKTIWNYFRDRKTFLETASTLTRSIAEGGFALDASVAASLGEFLKEVKDKIKLSGGLVVEETEDPNALASEPPTVAAIKAFKKVPVTEPVIKEQPKIVITEPVAMPPKSDVQPMFRRPLKKVNSAFSDIRYEPKLVGPAEELGMLSLENFRRLGKDTNERLRKIMNKFDLLSKESLTKRAAGIKAWRQSPLYKMYMAIGRASLESELTAEQVIAEYLADGTPVINFEEFNALSDLNKELRF